MEKRSLQGLSTSPRVQRRTTLEELLLYQMVQQEALTRLLIAKGVFSKEEFLGMVRVVDREKRKGL